MEIRIKMEENQKKIDTIEKELEEKDVQISNLVSKIEELNYSDKENILNKIENLHNIISEKDVIINDLKLKVNAIEERIQPKTISMKTV